MPVPISPTESVLDTFRRACQFQHPMIGSRAQAGALWALAHGYACQNGNKKGAGADDPAPFLFLLRIFAIPGK